MTTKYPIYIISKGRWDNPLTAKFFLEDGIDFFMVIEPQEYDLYKKTIPEKYLLMTDFANLGLGSYPARNFAWEHALKMGHKRHWCFDDNISRLRQFYKGKKVPVDSKKAISMLEEFTDRYTNIGITAFNYGMFVVANSVRKSFFLNVHAYSARLIKTDVPFRWRMKYNEDVDLCLQFLHNKHCTILSNVLMCDKVSTTAKMKGGNQTELYKGNAHEKKVLKARSLEEVWPQYAETVWKFNRPHHKVDWGKHFTHPLIRRNDIDWEEIRSRKVESNITVVKPVQSNRLKNWIKKDNK